MLTAKQIRESFKEFFKSKGHTIVPSAPMVIKDDPTLMFTNAGMNQFKDIILGNKKPDNRRVADSQKCLRVSGKHNDLEEVGMDTYHHTMFEMLGNWSFGDYFKQEAIDWAWEYLVDVLKLDPARLYATVFEGSKSDNIGRDDEAAAIWEKHLPADHIINGNKKDNFWEMGDTGPCGPCSEIHIDLRSDEERAAVPGRDLVNKDNPQVIEIWNLVFMQYNRKADGSLEPLPARVIDTGMGFERLCMALQGKKSNYDTDVFTPLIGKIASLSDKKYGEDPKVDIAMRVIADHVRTIAFSIADSQLPSNAKAGYVIRRILRRAVRYAYTYLGQRDPFMYRLVDTLIDTMGEAYPELPAQRDLIMKVIKEEEETFLRTLEKGINLLDEAIKTAKNKGQKEISGVEAFTLYDTYGFPLDLTRLILRENGMTLNEAEFDEQMQAQKTRARNAAAVETTDWTVVKPDAPDQQFVGYDKDETVSEIARFRKIKQKNREFYQIILTETPFYAEMGGQVGDRGTLTDNATGEVIEIFDTKRENGTSVHLTKKMPANPEASFTARIDTEAREKTAANHSATHLIHHALRQVLGDHVEQRGSFVSPESLRFDFSHYQKLSKDEIKQIEHLVNKEIRRAIPRDEHRELPIDKARELGAMALFGEKYGDKVRVIRFGDSIELCGGTHVANTGNIGMVKIVSESSIAAGIRRLEAVTGENVEDLIDQATDTIEHITAMLKNAPDVLSAVERTIEENTSLKKQMQEAMVERANALTAVLLEKAVNINGYTVVVLGGVRLPDVVKTVANNVRRDSPENTVFVATTTDPDNKPLITVAVTDDLVKQGLNAAVLARLGAKEIKGGGGGQPTIAQAGGKDAEGLTRAQNAILEQLKSTNE